ncbi:MAG: dihydropteroate synthase [Pseudomonadota bacterium]
MATPDLSAPPALREPLLQPLLCERGAPGARRLTGGWAWFNAVLRLERNEFGEGERRVMSLAEAEAEARAALGALTAPRAAVLGLSLDRPRIMGVLNATPDSFSDGGRHLEPERAVEAGLAMLKAGADILDIGGESTRPGAAPVSEAEERDRVLPVIEGLRAAAPEARLSVDTRKAAVAEAAFAAGARLFNDVSALSYDPAAPAAAAALMRESDAALCLMHAQGDPRTMQDDPRYQDALLDVAAFLQQRLERAVAAGAPRERIVIDPGIGFGKTLAHNIMLMDGLGALHSLGAPILLGVSRKRMIGALSGVEAADRRQHGSVAAALFGAARGAQILRVHDVAETAEALAVWMGLGGGAAEFGAA